MKHLKLINKITALFLTMVMLLSTAVGVVAVSPGDPCLLYGNDPEEGNLYETYGNEVFFEQNRELKTPVKAFTVILNREATQNIYKASLQEGSVSGIVNESYFPELNNFSIACGSLNAEVFSNSISYFLYDDSAHLRILIYLDDWSRNNVKRSIELLSPRSDVDIEGIRVMSYCLSDVTMILKNIAGWHDFAYINLSETDKEVYDSLDHDDDYSLDMQDVVFLLKIIAGWDVYPE